VCVCHRVHACERHLNVSECKVEDSKGKRERERKKERERERSQKEGERERS
jgi:hypothetical protein